VNPAAALPPSWFVDDRRHLFSRASSTGRTRNTDTGYVAFMRATGTDGSRHTTEHSK
jgi:hypothetical protein